MSPSRPRTPPIVVGPARLLLLSALAVLLAAGPACKGGYGVAIDVTLPEGAVDRAYTFTTSVYAPAAAAEVGSCADLEWGAHHLDELASALVGSQLLGGKLEVPRMGTKLVLVEAVGNESQRLALRGCAEVGEITEETTVEVALHHVARLALEVDGPLTATVPFGSSSELSNDPFVLATDHTGAPLAGADVRGTFAGPEGETVVLGGDGSLLTDDEGRAVLSGLTASTMGPFSIRAAARHMAPPAPPVLTGFGVPEQTVVDALPPAADRFRPRVIAPARVGPDAAAFVALGAREVMNDEGEWETLGRVAFLLPDADSTGLPTFTAKYAAPPDERAATVFITLPVAVLHDVDGANDDQGVVMFQGIARSSTIPIAPGACHLWTARPNGQGEATSTCVLDANAEFAIPGAAPVLAGQVGFNAVVPVGLCELHEEAGPWVAQARREEDNRLVLIDPLTSSNVVRPQAQDARPIASFCVTDEAGDVHRQLLMLSQPKNRWHVMDLGPGLTTASLDDEGVLSAFPIGEVDLYGVANAGHASTQGAEVMLATLGSVAFDINGVRFVDDGDGGIATEAQHLYSVPGAPRFMLSGAFLTPGQRDDIHVLSVSAGSEEGSLAPISIAAGVGGAAPVQQGVLPLRACPDGNCIVTVTDYDHDGINEVFVAKTLLTATDLQSGDPDGGDDDTLPIITEVLRFTE